MIRERRSTTVPAIASGISTQYRIVWAQMTRCPTLSAGLELRLLPAGRSPSCGPGGRT